MIRVIVVGVDESDASRHAVAWAADLAESVGAEVVAVHGRGLLERFASGPADPSHPEHDAVRARFEHEWCAPLADRAVASRAVLREAAAPEAVVDVAREVGADLVVVGRRGAGRGGGSRGIGSTSDQVVRVAHVPVVVVPS